VGSPGDLDDLLRVGKADPRGNAHDLEPSFCDPAVTLLPAGVGYRDVLPRKIFQLLVQGGLVGLDRDQIMRFTLAQVGGVLTLGVQGVGGDQDIFQILDLVQRDREHGDLVGLAADDIEADPGPSP
jgi:hypothetical protein